MSKTMRLCPETSMAAAKRQANVQYARRWIGTFYYGRYGSNHRVVRFFSVQLLSLHVKQIASIATADHPTPARRPLMSVLDCSKIERTYAIRRPQWELSLMETLDILLGIEKEKGRL